MLEKEQDNQVTQPPASSQSEPTTALMEANKKRVKLGSIIGGLIFVVLLLTIIILVASSSPTPVPPKPVPKPVIKIGNPFVVDSYYTDDYKHLTVNLINNRTELEKNGTNRTNTTMPNVQPLIKNTTENPEPNHIQVIFEQLDEHMLNIRYNDPEWPRWVVPEYGRDVDPYAHITKQIRSNLGLALLHKPDNMFEWNFFGKHYDMLPVMTTEGCRLQYFDKYIEFEARVQTDAIYGMGERVESFILKNDNYSLWNRDITYQLGQDSETGTYSSHPFFLNRLKDKKDFIGVFMRNSNAMLFSYWNVLNVGTFVNFKMIGGIIDLFIFHATDADYILKKYHALIGRPYLPPVWGMGFHQARRGYTLDKMKEVIKGHQEHRIPIESIWADVDINQNGKTFTVDSSKFNGLKEFVKWLHDLHEGVDMRFVVIANPGLKKEVGYKYYDEAVSKRCLIMSAANHDEPLEGKTLAGTSVFLDFFNHDATLVWAEGLHDLRELSEFDGIWISENEPSSMCDGECKKPSLYADEPSDSDKIPNPFNNYSEFDYLQYRPTLDPLERSTLSMTGYHTGDVFFNKQYYTHNLFGLQITKATFESLYGIFEDKRFFIASRSTWPGSGHYGGHWLGENYATWDSMLSSIAGILNFNMFGIPHVGAGIGGYYGDIEPELLARWYELGCFYPLMLSYTGQNSNAKEAYAIPEIRDYIKNALLERYGLLRFMYTQMFESYAWGGAVVHPLFFEFPDDETTFKKEVIDRTFMWGKTLYIIPALIRGQTRTRAYLPNWRWYDLRTLEMVTDKKPYDMGEYFTFDQPLGHITVLIKAGSIIPYQRGARDAKVMNTEDLKLIPALIVIAPDHEGKAQGTMISDAEGIRPHPDPASHTYRHYAFTYMNQIFRINKLAGFDFHEVFEYDYFWELIILDVFGQHGVSFACMLQSNMLRKDLEFNKFMGGNAVMIHDSNMAKIPMYNMESIVWGTPENYDFCKYQLHVSHIEYPSDEKSVNAILATSDPEAHQLVVDLKGKLLTNSILSLQIMKAEHGRYPWVVPDVIDENIRTESKATIRLAESGFRMAKEKEDFYFELSNPEDSHDFIFTSRNMPFVMIKDFIHLKMFVNSRHIFGLGERIAKYDLPDGIYSMFNADRFNEESGIPPGNNMYGSHPFYLVHLHDPKMFAGAFFLNSNPMDFKIRHVGMQTQIDHIFTGGIIDAFFFQRGSVFEIMRSYQYLVGKPDPLPFWAFGYHQSRWGYRDIEHLKDVVRKFESSNMPLDAIWMDKDYMDNYKDFTVDTRKWYGIKQFVEGLHERGKHFVAIVDAGIAVDENYKTYTDGLERGVYVQSSFTNKPLIGVTWPGYTVWVDYLHPSSSAFWEDQLDHLRELVPFDGIWLDMNEPSNMCDGECPDGVHYMYYHFPIDYYDDLYYNPTHRALEKGTISMEATHYGGTVHQPEYNYHNLYGLMQSRATARYFWTRMRKRPFIISSSTFPGVGRYASHWLGDNHSSWHMMEYSISGMLSFQLFGIPFVGADICGFDGNSTINLCARWMQLGAFYPFMRNHNSPQGNPQEPYVDAKLASVSRKAIRVRYSLARYLYSLYMHSALEGGAMIHPVLFLFPHDIKLYDIIDTTFMFGHALRVDPVLSDGVSTLTSYFPNNDWYDFFTLRKVVEFNTSSKVGKNVTMQCSLDSENINLHIRGGSIFPYQDEAISGSVTTISSMVNHTMKLMVAQDHSKIAQGRLFYDDDQTYSTFSGEYHDIRVFQNNTEIRFELISGGKGYKYEKKDSIITHVEIIGARDYQNTQCAKVYDNNDKNTHILKHTYDQNKEMLVLEPESGYTMYVFHIDKINWYNTTC